VDSTENLLNLDRYRGKMSYRTTSLACLSAKKKSYRSPLEVHWNPLESYRSRGGGKVLPFCSYFHPFLLVSARYSHAITPCCTPPTSDRSKLCFTFYLFVFTCVPSQRSHFSYLKILQYSLLSVTLFTTHYNRPVTTYSHIQVFTFPSFPLISCTFATTFRPH